MSLLDHSFHDFDIDLWVNNFAELTEPEYLIQSIDEIKLSPECTELLALLKKDDKESTFDKIVAALSDKDMPVLYSWVISPERFIEETGIDYADDRYIKFLSEFIPGYILYRNQWDRNQFGIEFREYYRNLVEPYNRRNTRLKKCVSCGYNITDLFTVNLTADNILDDEPVTVVCPHCNTLNYIKY